MRWYRPPFLLERNHHCALSVGAGDEQRELALPRATIAVAQQATCNQTNAVTGSAASIAVDMRTNHLSGYLIANPTGQARRLPDATGSCWGMSGGHSGPRASDCPKQGSFLNKPYASRR
jgi:hypothetical protein